MCARVYMANRKIAVTSHTSRPKSGVGGVRGVTAFGVFYYNRTIFFLFFFAVSKIILIFAPSLVSPAVGERAVIYMRKTFSNVCRCDS